jgi:hypothetical protein
MSAVASLLQKVKRPAAQAAAPDPDHVPVGLRGILAATENLLAVNRGLAEPDERDAMQFKRLMTTDRLLRERVNMDADKTRFNLLRRLARAKSLKPVAPGVFNSYAEGLLVGNPLSMPLEEINPMHLVEQARRVTHMGPGGLPSDESITPESQNIHPSQAGFISVLEGPECFSSDTEVFTDSGWIRWPEVKSEMKLACRMEGRLEFHRPLRLICEPYSGEMIQAAGRAFNLLVTTNHRLWVSKHHDLKDREFGWRYAYEAFGKTLRFDTGHISYDGRLDWKNYTLPVPSRDTNNQVFVEQVPIEDWCEFMGWYLSEGCFTLKTAKKSNGVHISQSIEVNPDCFRDIADLLGRMPFAFSFDEKGFKLPGKQLAWYLSQFGYSADKFIPEELLHAPWQAREKMFWALLKGDGRINKKHTNFCSISRALASGFERLAISLGHTTNFRQEKDNRPEVKSTNYAVSVLKLRERVVGVSEGVGGRWSRVPYNGYVYCAEVPGSMLLTRRGQSSGIWSGNSSRAGVDVRLAWGTKLGDDGKIYQKFRHPKTQQYHWLSPEDLDGKTVALPD